MDKMVEGLLSHNHKLLPKSQCKGSKKRVRNGRGLFRGEKGYRKFLSEEPHVGHPVVDLAQHVLQILTGYPKHIQTFGQEIKHRYVR